MHYYQYNIADYRKDTTHLTLLEHGCYRQLLDQYYLDEEPLPAEEDKLFRLFNARTEDEKQAMRNVLLDFWTKTEDGYVQGRSDREIQTYKERLETASRAGRVSAEKRANSNGRSTGVDLNSTGVQLTTNHKPITTNLITNNQYTSKDFDVFWEAFPKKKKKEDARKAWNTIRPNIEEVLKAIEWQKQSPEWFKQGGQFIPYPATWIRSHSWEDEKSVSVTF
ncbi:hypothetical protein P19250A_0040 [Methylophilaceae phage P19250A]|nr:hypothetical protein P19250A_0040 [Methylophilaceae phage P19250A]